VDGHSFDVRNASYDEMRWRTTGTSPYGSRFAGGHTADCENDRAAPSSPPVPIPLGGRMTESTSPVAPRVILTSREFAVGSRALDEVAETDPESIGSHSVAVAAATDSFAATLARVRSAWASNAASVVAGVRDVTVDGQMLVPLDLPSDDRLLVSVVCKAYALDLSARVFGSDSAEESETVAFVRELIALAVRLESTA